MKPIRLCSKRGSGMVLAFFAIMLVFTLGVSFLSITTSSMIAANRDGMRASAMAAAEAGVDKAISRLMEKQPGETMPGTYTTGHGTALPNDHSADTSGWQPIGNDEDYWICVRAGSGPNAGKAIITSIGRCTRRGKSVRQTIKAVVKVDVENVGVWNNAIFGGVGQAGKSINGNVRIMGSMHLLGDGEDYTDLNSDGKYNPPHSYTDSNNDGKWNPGEPFTDADGDGLYNAGEPYVDVNGNGMRDPALTVTDLAEDLGGNACVGNNYSEMPANLRALLPNPPTTSYSGETVESLSTKLRVKHGRVNISGAASVGIGNSAGNAVKETVDGTFVNDGFGGSAGTGNVHSDNGFSNGYDLGEDVVDMPVIDSGAYTKDGVTYTNYLDYLKNNGTVVNGSLDIANGTAMTISGPNGTLTIDNNGNMHIEGVVFVNGDITFGPGKSTIKYDGSGTLVTTGSAYVHCNLLPKTQFPTSDCLGLIARDKVELATGGGDAQLTMAIAMYAQHRIISNKQNEVAGTMVASYYQMSNVPRLYQVPELMNHLPPGMPGSDPVLIVRVSVDSWQQI